MTKRYLNGVLVDLTAEEETEFETRKLKLMNIIELLEKESPVQPAVVSSSSRKYEIPP